MSKVTRHPQYRKQRAKLLRLGEKNQVPCCYCGGEVDYSLAWPDPWSATADHAHPTSTGGAAYGPNAELRIAHARCNRLAGNRWGAIGEGTPQLTEVVEYVSPSVLAARRRGGERGHRTDES